jgi:hypothetical protein
VDYLEIGLELVKIALARGIGKDPTGILKSVSKNILSYHGLKIREDNSLEKVLFVKKRTNLKTTSRNKNKKKKKRANRLQTGGNKNFDDSSKNAQNSEFNKTESENNDFSLKGKESADEDDYSLDSEEVSTFFSEDVSFDNFENIIVSDDDEFNNEFAFDINKYITDEFMLFEQPEKLLDNEEDA